MIDETKFRSLPVTEFPALVLLSDDTFYIQNSKGTVVHHGEYGSIVSQKYWWPFTPPPLPKRDAFEEWIRDKKPWSYHDRDIWDAATASAIAAERARFAEGVEDILERYDIVKMTLRNDLRALARGDGGST